MKKEKTTLVLVSAVLAGIGVFWCLQRSHEGSNAEPNEKGGSVESLTFTGKEEGGSVNSEERGVSDFTVGQRRRLEQDRETGNGGGVPGLLLEGLINGYKDDANLEESLHTFRMHLFGIEETQQLDLLLERILSSGIEDPAVQFSLRQGVLEQWARLDGQGALEKWESISVDGNIYDHDAFSRLINVWAEEKPLAALEWYHAEGQDNLVIDRKFTASPVFYEKVFGAYFRSDSKAAIQAVSAISSYDQASAAVRGMVEKSAHPGHLMEIFEGLTASEDLKSKNALVATAYAKANMPEEAAKWVDQVPSQSIRMALAKEVADQWVNRAPFEAADWFYTHAKGQPDGLDLVAGVLAKYSPTAMEEWASGKKITL